MKKKRIKIALLNLGNHLPLNLPSLSRKINSLQDSFYFEYARTLSPEKFGNPEKELWYDSKKLLEVLKNEPRLGEYDYVIGITRFPFTEYSELNLSVKEYFSKSDFERFSIISTSPLILRYKAQDTDIYQFVAYICLCELLINMCKEERSHPVQKYCLFDECDDRIQIQECIRTGKLCDDCWDKIKKKIESDIIPDIQRILLWCKRYRWRIAAKNAFRSPVFSLVFGALLGYLIQLKMPQPEIIVISSVLFIYVIVLFYYRYKRAKKGKE